MKKIIILFILLLALSLSLSAEYVTATITSSDVRNDISFLNKNHIDVDKVKGNQIYLYLFDDDIALLEANGYLITITPNLAKEYADQLWEETKNTRDPMRDYYSLAEYETFMQNTANSYPNICELVDIGDTVDGNDILFMKISDNVMTDENEPEVRYISSIHGDEVVGFDCLIRLIDLLTSDYGTDTRITDIVNSTELWINPMFNPDGYLNHERYNSNGVDLNRNFPTPAGVQHPDGNTWQPETQTIMNWSEGHYFTSSLMFHGGATVMNYPWDYTPVLAPDDLLLQEMALSYAEPYTAMYNSSEFTDGITNGNAWYEIQGSIQDWSYGLTNCFDITAELYDTKWPNSSLLESLWNQNEESLLAYIEFAQNGVRGVVRDEERFPLEAVITVSGNSKTITTHPTTGDYHRLLLPGTYTMTATLDGYRSQTITDIVVPANGNITVNFELQEAQMISFDGILRYADGSLFAGGQINFDAQNIYTVANDGTFSASLMQGEYETLAVDGVAFYYLDISLWESPENACFVFGGEQDLLSDNFEAGLTQWQSTGSWGIENSNGSNTLSDSPSGDYNNDTNTYARIASPLSLNNASATLSFDMYYDLESGYDYGYLEVSSNGTNWEELDSYNGTQNWQEFSYNITGFDNFYFRFRIYTDGGVVDDGMKIDNIALTVANPIHGDFDGDNVLTNTDLDLIADYALNGSTPWDITDIAYADLDDDGEITYMDAGLFRRYLRGTIGQLPFQSGNAIAYSDPVINFDADEDMIFVVEMEETDIYALMVDFDSFDLEPTSSPEYEDGYYLDNGSYRLLYLPDFNQAPMGLIITLNYLLIQPLPFLADVSCNGFDSTMTIDSFGNDDNQLDIITELSGNYPNPFNPTTTISYSVASNNENVEIAIYDIRGRRIRTLINEQISRGEHEIIWDGTNENRQSVASGVYFYRLSTESKTISKKMVLLK